MESLVCNICLSVAAHKNCLSRSVPEIHLRVAETLNNKQTTTTAKEKERKTQKDLVQGHRGKNAKKLSLPEGHGKDSPESSALV